MHYTHLIHSSISSHFSKNILGKLRQQFLCFLFSTPFLFLFPSVWKQKEKKKRFELLRNSHHTISFIPIQYSFKNFYLIPICTYEAFKNAQYVINMHIEHSISYFLCAMNKTTTKLPSPLRQRFISFNNKSSRQIHIFLNKMKERRGGKTWASKWKRSRM